MRGASSAGARTARASSATNTDDQRMMPVDVSGLASGVLAIEAGAAHTCALTTGNGVKCWGWNGFGQVGDNTQTQRNAPADVVGLDERREHHRDRSVPRLRAGRQRRQMLGLERLRSDRRQLAHAAAGRRSPSRASRAACRHRRGQRAHLRADVRELAQVLGRRHVRSGWRRKHGARSFRRRSTSSESAARSGSSPAGCIPARAWRRARVLGAQQQRPARRRLADATPDAGRRGGPGGIRLGHRRGHALVRADDRAAAVVLGRKC